MVRVGLLEEATGSSGAMRLYLALALESLSIRCARYVPWRHVPSSLDHHHKGAQTLACTPYSHVTALYLPLRPLYLHLPRPPVLPWPFPCSLPPPTPRGTRKPQAVVATLKHAQVTSGLGHQVLGLKRP